MRKTGRGKGCLVLAEAAIPSSGGQDRLKEAKETKRKEQAVRGRKPKQKRLQIKDSEVQFISRREKL